MPSGHFSMFLSTSSFVFCNKRGGKPQPKLATALCWRQAWKDMKFNSVIPPRLRDTCGRWSSWGGL